MSRELGLPGLDGANPLAFLAALGSLRTLRTEKTDVTLHWVRASSWQPVICCATPISKDEALDVMASHLKREDAARPFALAPDLKVSPSIFRQYASDAVATASLEDRRWPDFAAAFGCDGVADEETIEDTALRTMSGAGHQHFLGFMTELSAVTSRDDLDRSLFHAWSYMDEGPSMRWDPADDRRYALRWRDPSGDKIRTMRGANRLAIEGFSLIPSIPTARGLQTVGFTGSGSRDTYWTWPIWSVPLSVDGVRTLLAQSELVKETPDRATLHARGVVESYRSQRVTVGKFRNFAPSVSV